MKLFRKSFTLCRIAALRVLVGLVAGTAFGQDHDSSEMNLGGNETKTDALSIANELQKELESVIASSETLTGRDYWAAILRFTNRGPDQRFYKETLPSSEWKAGMPVSIDVEIHTEEEVVAGRERNRVARAVLAELCTNRLDQLSPQTQEKLVECMYNLWGNDLFLGVGKKNSIEDHIDFLFMAEAILSQPNVAASAKSRTLFFVKRQSDNLLDPVEKQEVMQRFKVQSQKWGCFDVPTSATDENERDSISQKLHRFDEVSQTLPLESIHKQSLETAPRSSNSDNLANEVVIELD